MAISSETAFASLLQTSPHSFHGTSPAELLRRPPSLVKCPFMRAFLGLKTTLQAAVPLRAQAISAKFTPDLLTTTADLLQHATSHEEVKSDLLQQARTYEEIKSSGHHQSQLSDAIVEPLTEMSVDAPESSGRFQARYANRKCQIMVLGLSVHSCPVEMREKLAVPEADWAHAIEELSEYPHIEEAGILSTCNRLEVYVSALSWHMGAVEVIAWMSQKSGIAPSLLREHLFVLQNQDALQHLFRVASGLDSLVLGEGQILSQVKHAMQMGQAVQGFGRQLTGLFKQAIVAGKRVRSETSIGTGSVSVSSSAVELAAKKLHNLNLKDASICIVGAGKMAKLLIKHLNSKGCTSLMVLNRSEERVKELQRNFPNVMLTYYPLCALSRCIANAHVVFTCTASDTPLVDKSTMEGVPCAHGRKLFVDISVPRNVSACVHQLDTAIVYNVDDLQEIVAGNKEERSRKALEAQTIIEEELKSFEAWQHSLETVPTIKKLRAYAERIRVGELEKCLSKLGDDLSVKDKKLVEDLSRTIVNKLLHGPLVHMRSDGPSSSCRAEILENMYAVERIFDLNSEATSPGRKQNARIGQVR